MHSFRPPLPFFLLLVAVLYCCCGCSLCVAGIEVKVLRRAAAGYVDELSAKLSNDEQNKQHPSWTAATAKLLFAFKNMPEERGAVASFVAAFQEGTNEDRFPELLCSSLQSKQILKCLPPSLSSSGAAGGASVSSTVRTVYASVFDKGTAKSAAWDFEIMAHLHRNATESILWEELPWNVRSVRIEGKKPPPKQQHNNKNNADVDEADDEVGLLPRVEIDDVLARLPPHVTSLVLSHVDVHVSSSPEDRRVTDVLEALELHHCRVSEAFLHSGPWFSLVTRLVLEDCHFYFFDKLPHSVEKQKKHESELDILDSFSRSLEQLRTLIVARPLFASSAPFFFLPQITTLILQGNNRKKHLENLRVEYSPHAMSTAQLERDREHAYPRAWQHHRNEFFDALSRLPALKHLHLENIALAATPARVAELRFPATLTVLELFNVRFKQFPDLTAFPASVSEVDFSLNDIATEFPLQQLEAAPNVVRVRMSKNKISGELETARLPRHLLELNCSGNALSGSLDLTSLPRRMEIFDVSHNQFSGQVNMLQLSQSMRFLFFNDNKLTGRYDVTKLPLLLVKVMFHNNAWSSLLPRR